MLSTLYLFQFFAFYSWQFTSEQVKRAPVAGFLAPVVQNRSASRWFGVAILFATGFLFVAKLGLMSGMCAWLIGLMGVGCLSVALEPFSYIRLPVVALIYLFALALEIFV